MNGPWTVSWEPVLATLGALLLLWLALLAALAWSSRDQTLRATLTEAVRLVPDVVRLLRRLAADPTLPRGVRLRLTLLVGYLLLPIDVVPDFVPVIGYADDAVVVALALRSVVRVAGPEALARHWPGTREGLAVLHRLAGIPLAPPETPPAARGT